MRYKLVRYIDQLGDTFRSVIGESDSLVDIEFSRDFFEANFPYEHSSHNYDRRVDYSYVVERDQ